VDRGIRRFGNFREISCFRVFCTLAKLNSLIGVDCTASTSFTSNVSFVGLVLDLLDRITTMSEDLQSEHVPIEAEKAGGTSLASNDDEKLRDFYARHDVSVDHVFAKRLGSDRETDTAELTPKSCHPHRFIRLNPRYNRQETLELIKVCWLS
jgi:hypothetical protein